MNAHIRIYLLPLVIVAGLVLAAYENPNVLGAIAPEDPTPAPAYTPTPSRVQLTASGRQWYWNAEGGFGLLLPARWTVGQAQDSAFGQLYPLGPAALARVPQGSAILVADGAKLTAPEMLAGLCACKLLPEMEDAVVGDGIAARRATFSGRGLARVEAMAPTTWYFVEHAGKLIAFSIYSPATLKSLDAVIATLSFDAQPRLGAEGLPAFEAARRDLAKRVNADEYSIVATRIASVDWPDACLGLSGAACAQAVTPGYRLIMKYGSMEYEYHTNLDGSVVVDIP